MDGTDDRPRGREAARKAALLALQDREFFERLLREPRAALESEDRIELHPDDVEYIVERVNDSRGDRSVDEFMKMWDHYHETGTWDDLWPVGSLW